MSQLRVLVLGAFDLLHWGHIRFLKSAQAFGFVHVGLSTDGFLEETKRRPVVPYVDRERMLRELGYTVHERPDLDVTVLFKMVQPQLYACGSDWLGTTHLEDSGLTREFLDDLGCVVAYIPRPHEMSTTRILERINAD